ncbi:MAG: NTP pyrophosphohydrolase [Porphyromonadaceae bacterium CG2_30_38_12]|nr:MAG: NTP pyrophosphohydrolase [Porphyromonadaceae bacterium CG2_30_38_12]
MQTEYFPLVDENGKVIGKASREECHRGTFWLHPVVHLHVLNSRGELYLQKRAPTKDIQPNKWDTAVGGHVDFGEEIASALRREAFEELGISHFEPVFLLRYKFVSLQEAELVHSHYCVYEGKIIPNPIEITEGKFWKISDIKEKIGSGTFTPNFENEFQMLYAKKLLPL